MIGSRERLFAALTTAGGLIAGGYEAHLAPQVDGWWSGVTSAPSLTRIAAAMAAGALVWLLGSVVSVRPFFWMCAGLLPFIPAITGVAPTLLFFSGYTSILLFAALLSLTSRDLIASLPKLGPASASLIAFTFFIFVGRFLPGPAGPQGDEPHYLLIAESLLKDGDVDLKNQFEEQAYSKFTSGSLTPHTAPRSPREKVYAIHTPGLPGFIAPGYALLGYTGARAVVSLSMAAVVGLLFLVSRSLFGAPSANFVFLLATFASPLPIYANALFPDSVATLPVALSLAYLVSPRPVFLGLAAAAIAALPWLHPRFLPLALLLALSITLREGASLRRGTLTFVPLFASVGLLLSHFESLFGSASLSAAYGPDFAADVSLSRIPWGVSALIMDRQFGLLVFAPILLFGIPGLAQVWKRDRLLAAVLTAVPAGLFLVGGSFSMWWGGASPPARFLIGAVPALIVLCGGYWEATGHLPRRRVLLASVSGFGLGLLWLACLAPRALHNRSDGDSGLLRLLSPALDVDRFFPGFVNGSGPLWIAGLWGISLIVAVLRPRFGLWFAALPFLFATIRAEKPVLDPFTSSIRALESWSDDRRTLGGRDREDAFVLEVPLDGRPGEMMPGADWYSPRFSLPKGAWTIQVEAQATITPGAHNVGRVSLVGDDVTATPIATLMIRAGEPLGMASFELPQSERRVHVRVEGLQSKMRILSVRLLRRQPFPLPSS